MFPLPMIVQGGMGVGVSNWYFAQAVSRAGQFGVVSATALDQAAGRQGKLWRGGSFGVTDARRRAHCGQLAGSGVSPAERRAGSFAIEFLHREGSTSEDGHVSGDWCGAL